MFGEFVLIKTLIIETVARIIFAVKTYKKIFARRLETSMHLCKVLVIENSVTS